MPKPKFLSENGLAYYWSQIKLLLAGKVDKETGKGLSTNDYSDAEKTKLTGITAGAEPNVITSIKVNNTTQAIDNKTVDITVPTKVSDIQNDLSFQENVIESVTINGATQTVTNKGISFTVPTNTNQLLNGADFQTGDEVAAAIADAVSQITEFDFQKVDSLPASGEKGIIYLVAHSHDTNDGFDEFIWLGTDGWERLGTLDIDLSGYMQTTDTITNAEIDQILAT